LSISNQLAAWKAKAIHAAEFFSKSLNRKGRQENPQSTRRNPAQHTFAIFAAVLRELSG
jgi:hypothetical protein